MYLQRFIVSPSEYHWIGRAIHSWRLRNSHKRMMEIIAFSTHNLSLSANPNAISCYIKGDQPLHLALIVLAMASWLVSVNLFILLVCIASSSVSSSLGQGTNDSVLLNVSLPESTVTTLKKASPLNLSWPASHPPPAAAKINTSLATAANVQNLTNSHLAAPRVKCDAATYGHSLNITSCRDAWELLPTSSIRRTVGQRERGNFDIPLPFRVLSREYKYIQCSAIDLAPVLVQYLLR